ncbi:sel1 repeat family protein [Acinetobacter sp. 194]|uniref:tetratricopeptide repeat protein n=1 Tax=Acinetobacter shaoyimingii TaxID=2715164 RepID=UPI00140DC892|nr:tetratricopeptide repeat protein [Acinetobacter shaoyimingii]NHB59036.1 sel1 repeat family protein [Acinetobacter shaoyimingii]
MKINKLTLSLVMMVGLEGCENNKDYSKVKNNVTTGCVVYNSEYGSIECDNIPISLNLKVNKKLIEYCSFKIESVEKKDIQCLEKYKDEPIESYVLGNLQYNGYFVDKDEKQGLDLIIKSSEKNNPEALLWLSKYYDTKGDNNLSIEYLKKSSQLEYPLAMYNLGYKYSRGLGINKNYIEAKQWLDKSKEHIPASYSELAIIALTNDKNVKEFIRLNEKLLIENIGFH